MKKYQVIKQDFKVLRSKGIPNGSIIKCIGDNCEVEIRNIKFRGKHYNMYYPKDDVITMLRIGIVISL